MKYLVVFMCSLMMTGCLYQSVDISDLKKAIAYCGSVEKVMSVDVYFAGSENNTCTNGVSEKTLNITLIK